MSTSLNRERAIYVKGTTYFDLLFVITVEKLVATSNDYKMRSQPQGCSALSLCDTNYNKWRKLEQANLKFEIPPHTTVHIAVQSPPTKIKS